MSENGDVSQYQREQRVKLTESIKAGLDLIQELRGIEKAREAYVASGGTTEELTDIPTTLENKPFLDMLLMSANMSAIVEYEFYHERKELGLNER